MSIRRDKPGTGKQAEFCPSHWGGKNWPPIAFSPKTRMIYIPANENLCAHDRRTCRSNTRRPRLVRRRDDESAAWRRARITSAKCRRGTSTPASACGRTPTPKSPNWGPMLATGGGLVFSGGTNDRKFHAFDASNGKLLWEFPTNSGIIGQPSSFLDRRQAVRRRAVGLGHRLAGDARRG